METRMNKKQLREIIMEELLEEQKKKLKLGNMIVQADPGVTIELPKDKIFLTQRQGLELKDFLEKNL